MALLRISSKLISFVSTCRNTYGLRIFSRVKPSNLADAALLCS